MHTISNFEPEPALASPSPVDHVPLLVHVDSAASTNDLARDLHRDPRISTPHLTLVLADHQTAGRGRLGRTWESPAGRSLTASLLVRIPSTAGLRAALPWFALAAALAARDAVDHRLAPLGHTTGVKWPNDVFVDGSRKVAGLLTELLDTDDSGLWMVVGLGVNLDLTAEELPTPIATALSLEGDEGAAVDPSRVIDALLCDWVDGMSARTDSLVAHDGDASAAGLHGELTAHCVTLGHTVVVRRPDDPGQPAGRLRTARGSGHAPARASFRAPATPGNTTGDTTGDTTPGDTDGPGATTGTATGIGPDGCLLVRLGDGETCAVTAGDVEVLAPPGPPT